MYDVFTTKQFDKRLCGLPVKWQKRTVEKIHDIAKAPYAPHLNCKKLQGRSAYRLRVGDWRIIYELQDDSLILFVLEIDMRGDIY